MGATVPRLRDKCTVANLRRESGKTNLHLNGPAGRKEDHGHDMRFAVEMVPQRERSTTIVPVTLSGEKHKLWFVRRK